MTSFVARLRGLRKMFQRTLQVLALLLVPALLMLHNLPTFGGEAPVVKIGHISPLSGPLATGAVYLRNGVELAVKDINASGGIEALRGARLEVVFGDSKGDPKVGASEAERLVTVEKVSGLMGAYQSSVCRTVSGVSEQYEVPFMINTGVLEDLTSPQKKYTFRHSARSSEFGASHINFLVEIGRRTGKPAKTLAVIHDDTDFGQSTSKGWRAAIDAAKTFNVVLEESLPINLTDISATMTKLRALRPDAILVAAYPTVDFLLTNGLAANRINTMGVFFSSGGPSNPVYFDNVGRNGEYFYAVNDWADDVVLEGSLAIQARYARTYRVPMNSIATLAYVGTWILKEAVEKARSADPRKVRDALDALTISTGPATMLRKEPIKFGPDHHITSAPKLVGQVQGGTLKTIWPFALAKSQPTWPMPTWEGR